MKRLRILCTLKALKNGSEIQITHIGGVNGTGERWNITVNEAISRLHSEVCEFFVVDKLQEYPVYVTEDVSPRLFASIPGEVRNLLEGLPDCL